MANEWLLIAIPITRSFRLLRFYRKFQLTLAIYHLILASVISCVYATRRSFFRVSRLHVDEWNFKRPLSSFSSLLLYVVHVRHRRAATPRAVRHLGTITDYLSALPVSACHPREYEKKDKNVKTRARQWLSGKTMTHHRKICTLHRYETTYFCRRKRRLTLDSFFMLNMRVWYVVWYIWVFNKIISVTILFWLD